MPTDILATLAALFEKQATTDQVMRAAIEHDDWFVSSLFAHNVLGLKKQRIVMLGNDIGYPPRTLLLYSDLASALHAHEVSHLPLGPYARGVPGVDLFRALADIDVVVVNEGCPTPHKLYLGGPSFGRAAVWADAIRLERLFEDEATEALDLSSAIRAYDAYFVALHEDNGAIVTLQFPGFGNAGLLFTAPDCLAAFLARYPEVPMRTGNTTGERVTQAMSSLDVDGFVVNAFGPGTTQVISVEELEIAALADLAS